MIWSDGFFDYGKNKTNFKEYCSEHYTDDFNNAQEYKVEYDEIKGIYRITHFTNEHWNGDVVFNEYRSRNNAYCPICNENRWIPDTIGYCCKCGHHLNRVDRTLGERK